MGVRVLKLVIYDFTQILLESLTIIPFSLSSVLHKIAPWVEEESYTRHCLLAREVGF